MRLVSLDLTSLEPTRNYLQDITLCVSSLQRGFLPKHPKYWQYGLEVTMRGICSQTFMVDGKEYKVLLDLVKNKIRAGGKVWDLGQVTGQQLFDEFNGWALSKDPDIKLEVPEFSGGQFDAVIAGKYSEALWWMQEQFAAISKEFTIGSVAPIYLYAHHFDLSLVWFPWDDDKQVAIGFSTGDTDVDEPYVYMALYPTPDPVNQSWIEKLPDGSHWQTAGFTGAVLPYSELQASDDPRELLRHFVGPFSSYAVANGF